MATGKITKRAVDAMSAGERTDFLWDDELHGFGLRVTPSGARSYVFAYRMGGREATKRRYTIGRHGSPWTPAAAREEAARLSRMVATGKDPADVADERRRQAVDLAFDAYAELFVRLYLKREWKRSWAGPKRLLDAEVIPQLRSKPLPSITKSDLSAVLDRMVDRPAVARLAFATLRKMFRWAQGRGDLERSPMEGMASPSSVAARDRVLTDDELAQVWAAATTLPYPFGPMFRLLMATGQRREEVAGLSWAELDKASSTWTLPAARAKNGKPHIVLLNTLAVAVLDEVASTIGASTWPQKGLVLTTNGKTAISGYSKAKTRLDAAIASRAAKAAEKGVELSPVEPWRVHDLRRTLATGLQRLGVRFEVTEAVLNHVSGSRSGVAGIYQRHDWKEEKRAALDAWGRHLGGL